MLVSKTSTNNDVVNYAKNVIMYTLFSNNQQNSEYDLKLTKEGFIFIPNYPTTFVLNETFYNKLFSILNLALTPEYTLIKPLTMQVITFNDASIANARGVLIPARKGKPKRLQGSLKELINQSEQNNSIPIMDIVNWDFVKSPHAVITGVSGSGKSYFLKYLFSICSNIGEVIAIDPKASDLARLAKKNKTEDIILPEFIDTNDGQCGISGKFLQNVVTTLKQLESEMYARQSKIYNSSTKTSTDYRELGLKPMFIFIDEVAALMTGANKQVKQDFQDSLTRLIVLGRESGIYLILSMQSARAEFLPTLVRDSISLRMKLGRINSENTRFLFPELNEIPMVPLGGKGSGILSIAGDINNIGIEPVLTPTILE